MSLLYFAHESRRKWRLYLNAHIAKTAYEMCAHMKKANVYMSLVLQWTVSQLSIALLWMNLCLWLWTVLVLWQLCLYFCIISFLFFFIFIIILCLPFVVNQRVRYGILFNVTVKLLMTSAKYSWTLRFAMAESHYQDDSTILSSMDAAAATEVTATGWYYVKFKTNTTLDYLTMHICSLQLEKLSSMTFLVFARRTPPSGELTVRGIECWYTYQTISHKWYKIRPRVQFLTNRKSYLYNSMVPHCDWPLIGFLGSTLNLLQCGFL